DLAMELGCSMAKLQNARLHVIHAAEFHEFDHMFPASISAKQKQAYRDEAEKHIEAQLNRADLPMPAKAHFVIEPPDFAIMNCVEQHDIDLVVMGTVGRAGISGFITGNTAERLLSRIPCSLLAVKPPGFKSPVLLE
ncbi:MAG: universal stress protein, partial [Planctomycetales bacterium]